MTHKYSYTKLVNVPKLQLEIESSEITIAISSIATSGEHLDISFKAMISSNEKALLDDIVATHVATPTPEIGEPFNVDGRPITHSTPRRFGLTTYFTGGDDSQSHPSAIGGGNNNSFIHHRIGDTPYQTAYLNFNTIVNDTQAHAGFLSWSGARGDRITADVVPQVTQVSPGVNTYFNLYGGFLVIPAAGDGVIDVNPLTAKLVEVPLNEKGLRSGAGYWNADYNTATGQFENMTPALMGDGRFNIFAYEVPMQRFINNVPLVGEGNIYLTSHDASLIGHNSSIKLTATTVGDDHEWMVSAFLSLFRKYTI